MDEKSIWQRLTDWDQSPIYWYFRIKKLIRQLSDEDIKVRENAAKMLAEKKDVRAIPALVDAIRDDVLRVRSEAGKALGGMGRAAIPGLIRASRDLREGLSTTFSRRSLQMRVRSGQKIDWRYELNPWFPQTLAMKALAQIAKENPAAPELADAIPALEANLYCDYFVSKEAAQTLAKLGPQVIPALEKALSRGRGETRIEALSALGKIGAPAFSVLADRLDNKELYSSILFALKKIIDESKTYAEATGLEKEVNNLLRGTIERKTDSPDSIKELFVLTELRNRVAKKKNELSKDKAILLDDKPKPPRRNKMYQQLRRVTSG